jgi:O-antigen ligase
LLVFCGLAGSLALGWAASQGQAELALALLVAGGGFCCIVFRPEFGILLLLSTMLLTYPDILQGQGLLTINNLLGAMFVLLLAGRIFFNRDPWFLQEREVKIFFLVGLAFVVSTMLAEYMLPALHHQDLLRLGRKSQVVVRDLTQQLFKDFVSRVAFLIFFINFITTRRHVRYVLLLLLACILLVIPPALEMYLSGTGEGYRVTAGKSAIGGGAGWLSNPNRFAFMCLVGTGLLFYFFATTQRQGVKLLTVLGVAILTALTLLSGSRSGFLGFFLMMGWFLIRGRRLGSGMRAGIVLLGTSAAITFFLLAPPVLQERLTNLNPFDAQGEGARSTERRTATMEQSLAVFAQYPVFGVGPGNFRWVNVYLHGDFKPPHNSYLWALTEGGSVCLVLYLLLFFALFKRLRLLRQELRTDPALLPIAEWLSFYLLLLLFFSFFADVWLEEVHLYLIAGLSIVLQRLAATRTEKVETAWAPSGSLTLLTTSR